MATISMYVFRSALCALCLVAAAACGSGTPDVAAVPTLVPLEAVPDAPDIAPVDLRTVQAQDLRRIRDEHAALIAMLPTPTPWPTRAPSAAAASYLLDGEQPVEDQQLVSDPSQGVWWYRNSGGDWTTSRIKAINPYYPLFYDAQVDSRYATFGNGGIQNEIGRLLVGRSGFDHAGACATSVFFIAAHLRPCGLGVR